MIRRLVTKMGTLASKLWPPFMHPRSGSLTPIVPPAKVPPSAPAQTEKSPALESPGSAEQTPSQLTQEQQDYLDLLENMRRPPAEVRRTDRFFILLFALITLAWIVAGVIWWLHRR